MGATVATFKEAASVYEWSPEIALKGWLQLVSAFLTWRRSGRSLDSQHPRGG
jgi:hypothetical protein